MRKPLPRNPKSEVGSQSSEIRDQRSEVSSGELEALVGEAYSRMIALHGEIGIGFEEFVAHLNSIAAKQVGGNAGEAERRNAIAGLIDGDYLSDIYLTAACALKSNPAWERFFKLYNGHIEKIAHSVSRNHQQARDVFSDVIVHLFSPDSSGGSRIASYNAQGALSTWLASIVKRLAINRSQLRSEIESANSAPLDSLSHTPSADDAARFDAALFSSRYAKAIEGAFKAAAQALDERERLVLAMRCDDDLLQADIAASLGIHPAQISRANRKAQLKFQTTVIECLGTRYKLSAEAIEECLAEMVHLGELSIATFLRSPSRTTTRTRACVPHPARLMTA